MLVSIFAWLDTWWVHRLHLPGGTLICDSFDRYLMADRRGKTDEQF
jgi:hypothetical protein